MAAINVLHAHRVVTSKDMFCNHLVIVSEQGFEFCLLGDSCVCQLHGFKSFQFISLVRAPPLHSVTASCYYLYITGIKHGICTHPLKLKQTSFKTWLKHPTVAVSLITFYSSCWEKTFSKRSIQRLALVTQSLIPSRGGEVQAAGLCLACTEPTGDTSHLRSIPKQDPQCNLQQPLADTKENAGRPNSETILHDRPFLWAEYKRRYSSLERKPSALALLFLAGLLSSDRQ